jgi:hypothetical protein
MTEQRGGPSDDGSARTRKNRAEEALARLAKKNAEALTRTEPPSAGPEHLARGADARLPRVGIPGAPRGSTGRAVTISRAAGRG